MNRLSKTALFIPTYNAITCGRDNFIKTLEIIRDANLYRVLIIDSSSIDNTVEVVKSYGFETKIIEKSKFDHSGTRRLACDMLSDSEFIIYITQDILLDSINSLIKLINPLIDNSDIAGVYGRQLPHKNANIFARHLRYFNYTDVGYICSYSDRFIYGIRSVFASDSFAAYRVSALVSVGSFPERLIFGEDSYIFAKLLQNKFKVGYISCAVCYHSHNYSIKDDFKRYFDIGVFHRSESWIINDFGHLNKRGMKFILSEFKFINFRIWLYPAMFLRTMAKYWGYKIGYNFDVIGVVWCRRLSSNPLFWW